LILILISNQISADFQLKYYKIKSKLFMTDFTKLHKIYRPNALCEISRFQINWFQISLNNEFTLAITCFSWEKGLVWRLVTWRPSCTRHIVSAAATGRYHWNLSTVVSQFWQVYTV